MQHTIKQIVRKLSLLLPQTLRKRLFSYYWTVNAPDRRFLVDTIIPYFAKTNGPLLWVGCQRYTKSYPALLERSGAQCYTLEIDPLMARFGRAGRHVVGDVRHVSKLFPGIRFSGILCNGVVGFGVNTDDDIQCMFKELAGILRDDGLLLLGWNTNRTEDPTARLLHEPYVASCSLQIMGSRKTFPNSTHVYDILRKQPYV